MNIRRGVSIGVLVVLCLVLVWWVGSAAVEAYRGHQWQKKTDAFVEALKKPYKEDVHGGATPEETWGMFLLALKKGDVDLASKYFVVEKQGKERDFLLAEKAFDNLRLFIAQIDNPLTKEEKVSTFEKGYYNYSFKDLKTGVVHSNSVVFVLNPYTKVWKISLL